MWTVRWGQITVWGRCWGVFSQHDIWSICYNYIIRHLDLLLCQVLIAMSAVSLWDYRLSCRQSTHTHLSITSMVWCQDIKHTTQAGEGKESTIMRGSQPAKWWKHWHPYFSAFYDPNFSIYSVKIRIQVSKICQTLWETDQNNRKECFPCRNVSWWERFLRDSEHFIFLRCESCATWETVCS